MSRAPLPQQLDCSNVSLWPKVPQYSTQDCVCVIGSVHPYHSSLTALMSHYGHNKCQKFHNIPPKIACAWISAPLPQQLDCPDVSLWLKIHIILIPPKIECAWISAPLPQQLDCPNVSLWV
eukprot:scaffold16530_cov66-Cyclotella_meneghiniana.AAC.2